MPVAQRKLVNEYLETHPSSLRELTLMERLTESQLKKWQDIATATLSDFATKYGLDFQKKQHGRFMIKIGKLGRKYFSSTQPPKVYGSSLNYLMHLDVDAQDMGHGMPKIFEYLIDAMRMKGLQSEGVLRKAGKAKNVETLKTMIDENFYNDRSVIDGFINSTGCGLNDIVDAFKHLIRELPEHLFTAQYEPTVLTLDKLKNNIPDLIIAVKALLLLIPAENRATLKAIFNFCGDVMRQADENKMTGSNVAIVMAPTVLFGVTPDRSNMAFRFWITEILITYPNVFFTLASKIQEAMQKQSLARRQLN